MRVGKEKEEKKPVLKDRGIRGHATVFMMELQMGGHHELVYSISQRGKERKDQKHLKMRSYSM